MLKNNVMNRFYVTKFRNFAFQYTIYIVFLLFKYY